MSYSTTYPSHSPHHIPPFIGMIHLCYHHGRHISFPTYSIMIWFLYIRVSIEVHNLLLCCSIWFIPHLCTVQIFHPSLKLLLVHIGMIQPFHPYSEDSLLSFLDVRYIPEIMFMYLRILSGPWPGDLPLAMWSFLQQLFLVHPTKSRTPPLSWAYINMESCIGLFFLWDSLIMRYIKELLSLVATLELYFLPLCISDFLCGWADGLMASHWLAVALFLWVTHWLPHRSFAQKSWQS